MSVGWGMLRQWGGGAASAGGVAASMEGCCFSEEGYYKIIWFYFLSC